MIFLSLLICLVASHSDNFLRVTKFSEDNCQGDKVYIAISEFDHCTPVKTLHNGITISLNVKYFNDGDKVKLEAFMKREKCMDPGADADKIKDLKTGECFENVYVYEFMQGISDPSTLQVDHDEFPFATQIFIHDGSCDELVEVPFRKEYWMSWGNWCSEIGERCLEGALSPGSQYSRMVTCGEQSEVALEDPDKFKDDTGDENAVLQNILEFAFWLKGNIAIVIILIVCVVFVIALVVAAFVVVYVLMKRKKNKKLESKDDPAKSSDVTEDVSSEESSSDSNASSDV